MAERLKLGGIDGAVCDAPFLAKEKLSKRQLWTSPLPRLTMTTLNDSPVHHYQGDLANVGNIHLPDSQLLHQEGRFGP
jgi:hypothetical protein